MNRFHALLIVLILWAGIFLPGLGSTELKGEEGRRILPAVTMLETGQWVVPYVGGKPFLRKPPLVNWAIAASFKLLDVRNEWAARLPSVLSMLALAAAIVLLARSPGWMNAETALVAAIFTLTQVAAIEKGRLAEIEAIYTALSGLAMLCWLAWFTQRRSPWLLWTVPFVFLGLGCLAKAPLHLLFFYAIVFCVLWKTREWRQLAHPAHFLGLALMAGVFALWFVPYHHDEVTRFAAQKWQEQFAGRVTAKFDFIGWITNVPRALSDHLPWLLFAPLLWRRGLERLGEREAAIFRGTRLAITACFFGLLVIPNVLPRYTMPLLVPFALLAAITLADGRLDPPTRALRIWWRTNTAAALLLLAAALAGPPVVAILLRQSIHDVKGHQLADFSELLLWPLAGSGVAVVLGLAAFAGRWKLARPALIATSSGALIAAAVCIYASSATPFMNRADVLRPQARAIDELVPANEKIYLYDPEYEPVIFYLQRTTAYALEPEEIPADAIWVLAREDRRRKLERTRPEFEVAREFSSGKLRQLVLLKRRG